MHTILDAQSGKGRGGVGAAGGQSIASSQRTMARAKGGCAGGKREWRCCPRGGPGRALRKSRDGPVARCATQSLAQGGRGGRCGFVVQWCVQGTATQTQHRQRAREKHTTTTASTAMAAIRSAAAGVFRRLAGRSAQSTVRAAVWLPTSSLGAPRPAGLGLAQGQHRLFSCSVTCASDTGAARGVVAAWGPGWRAPGVGNSVAGRRVPRSQLAGAMRRPAGRRQCACGSEVFVCVWGRLLIRGPISLLV